MPESSHPMNRTITTYNVAICLHVLTMLQAPYQHRPEDEFSPAHMPPPIEQVIYQTGVAPSSVTR